MPIPIAPYDPDNRFMKCAREHKLETLERSDSSSDSVSDSYTDNRFAQCALQNKMQNRSISCSLSVSGSTSASDSENRFTQFAIQGKSEHRPRTYSQNTDYRTQIYSEHRSRTYSQTTEHRTQTQIQIHSPDNSPKINKKDVEDFPSLCTKSLKPILMSPLRITTPIVSSPIATVLSVKDGKVIQKDIYEDVEPLVITPSKWSDVLKYTSGK